MTTTIGEIDAVERAAHEYGLARANEVSIADERALAKTEAIRRLIGTPNELSGGKPHTFSSAETRCEEDDDYARVRSKQAENLLNQELWKGRLFAAQLRAQLAVAMVKP